MLCISACLTMFVTFENYKCDTCEVELHGSCVRSVCDSLYVPVRNKCVRVLFKFANVDVMMIR